MTAWRSMPDVFFFLILSSLSNYAYGLFLPISVRINVENWQFHYLHTYTVVLGTDMDGSRCTNAMIAYHLHSKDTYYSSKYTSCRFYHAFSLKKKKNVYYVDDMNSSALYSILRCHISHGYAILLIRVLFLSYFKF